jgi:hypothetical protein
MSKLKISLNGQILNETVGTPPAQNSIIKAYVAGQPTNLRVVSIVNAGDSLIVETVQDKQTLNG